MTPEIRRLVIEMMPQAKSEAWKVFQSAPHALDLDDLTSLAYTGLVMAATRWPQYCAERGFDPGATQYFAAYCLRRIRGAMLDAMRSADWVTRSMRAKAKAIAEADAGHGRGEDEIAAATGLSRRQIRDTLAGVAGRPVPFDAESHDVAGPGDTESQVVVSSVLDAVLAVLDRLDGRAQVVVALRFHRGLDFAEIAGLLGLPEQRVTDLHNAAVLAVHDAMLRAVT
jgi:RNA polymerase sigma factor for flagellar operon FliA